MARRNSSLVVEAILQAKFRSNALTVAEVSCSHTPNLVRSLIAISVGENSPFDLNIKPCVQNAKQDLMRKAILVTPMGAFIVTHAPTLSVPRTRSTRSKR